MKHCFFPCLVFLLSAVLCSSPAAAASATSLRYDRPAEKWTEALPVGNGRLGAMIYGGVSKEVLQLNETTLWSGAPRDWNNPAGPAVLAEVRKAVFAGDYLKADQLCREMQGPYNESYQPLGDLVLDFVHDNTAEPASASYEHTLDIDRAVVTTRYEIDGTTYTREVFSSHPDQVIVVRLTASRPGKLNLTIKATSLLRHETTPAAPRTLVMRGRAPSHVAPNYYRRDPNPVVYDEGENPEGMAFALRVAVHETDGAVTSDAGEKSLVIKRAGAITLLVSAATSFNGPFKSPGREGRDADALAARPLNAAKAASYAGLVSRHIADHQKLFRRVSLDLGGNPDVERLTTEARLIAFAEGKSDPSLATLLFNYGRYLLIASSRPAPASGDFPFALPANLQGIWNDEMRPPWGSNWTLNINTQMNYWPAEPANLSECHEPLFAYIENLAVNGRKTAGVNYGVRGWCAHHNADIWCQTAPVGEYGKGGPRWANWGVSGPWLCLHLWEHYAFTRDEKFLRERAWPVLRGAAEFCLDWLIDDGKGRLVTAPSFSPEIGFNLPDGSGRRAETSMASTMDMSIIWEHFTNCIEAARILKTDADFAQKLAAARARLYPLKIGARGQIQEWFEDFMETDEHHRHVSHLFGLHPGHQITPASPELFAAARRVLEIRGDDGTGWSLGWKINFWARLLDGDRAWLAAKNLLRPIDLKSGRKFGGIGGVYINLFDAHPPFQIDGNFAFTAGVAEMLLQSHNGEIHLLPALPAAWLSGSVRGLRARGGFEVDIEWASGKLTRAAIRGITGGDARIRHGENVIPVTFKPGESYTLTGK
jgi:alpha-L-fucosidase 2